MGIYGALSTAVSGLRAQSQALENISGNIANSQTTGYKRMETTFVDMIADAPVKQQVPGAVMAQSRSTNGEKGDIQTVSNETFIALNGGGFFVVEPSKGQSNGQPTFTGANLYTRRGDFQIDKDGLLVNGAGYYLKGMQIDRTTGNVSGSVPGVIKLSNAFLPAQQTTGINYQANLPQVPINDGYDVSVKGSELLNTDDFVTPATATGSIGVDGVAPMYPFVSVGDKLTLKAGGDATVTFEFYDGDAGPFTDTATTKGIDIRTTPTPVSINTALAEIQTKFRATSAAAAGANVGLNGGTINISLGTNKTGVLQASSGSGALGLPISVTATATGSTGVNGATPMDPFVSVGDTLTLKAGSDAAVTFEFYDSALGPFTDTATTKGIDIHTTPPAVSIDDALAEIQAKFRATGGAAASAAVGLNGNAVTISLGANMSEALEASSATNALGLPVTATAIAPTTISFNPSTPTLTTLNTISADNNAQFLANSIQGAGITVYAKNGAPASVTLRWAKVDSGATGTGHADTWNVFYMSNSEATGGGTMWTRVPQDYVFNAAGEMAPPVSSTIIPGLTVNGVNVGDVTLQHGTGGMQQQADITGQATVTQLNQNGYGAGKYESVSISDDGRVVASYSNGQHIDMAQVVTANFNAVNELKRMDGGVFAATSGSGEPILDINGNGIMGGALEASNTDISDEFTKLIITQQAYAAGTKIVSTANDMLQQALSMIR